MSTAATPIGRVDRRDQRRWWRVFAGALVVALLVAGLTGWWEWRKLAPRPLGQSAYGQWFSVDGMSYRVDPPEVADHLPSQRDPQGEAAPAGTRLVRVRVHTRADRTLQPEEHACGVSLVNAAGQELTRLGPTLDESLGTACYLNLDAPMRTGEEQVTERVLIVPVGATDGLRVRLTPRMERRAYWVVG